MIQRKSFINTIKRALQTGTFNFMGQEAKEFPQQLFAIDKLQFEDQSWWDCVAITKMDLSNNEIQSIPGQLVIFPDLQLIRMKNNKVQGIPKALGQLQNLKSIDLSRNKLKEVPSELSYFPALVEINFGENLLEWLPDLSKVQTLELVTINDNRLRVLPAFGNHLKRLEASANMFKEVPANSFTRCSQLEHLNLSKNQIERVQQGAFSNAINLVNLELKENRLVDFTQVPASTKLDSISLAFNRLSEYDHFSKSPNLTVLILADNKIKTLSKGIIQLTKLKTLDVSNNDLSDLPCEIGFLKELVRIQLEGNPLKCIRQNIRVGGTNVIKKYLQERVDVTERAKLQSKTSSTFESVNPNDYWLKLINQFNQNGELLLRKLQLKLIDDSVFDKDLKTLNFSENSIRELSQKVGKLQSLKNLIANSNELQSLPASLGQIPTLQMIEAKGNRLTTFGSTNHALNQFPWLHYLDLSGNRLSTVPKCIVLLRNIRTLHLSYNQIVDVNGLWERNCLNKLEILDVSSNQIQFISDEVFTKFSLNYLNLESNNIAKLPTILGFMKLSGLKVDGNPLKQIKRQVIERGTVALLQFLKTKHSGDVPEPIPLPKVEQPPKQISKQEHYPYETERFVEVKKTENEQNVKRLKEVERQIASLQKELQNNMGMNNMQKMEKKKRMQALMVQRNRIK